jgi:hypothetical protein
MQRDIYTAGGMFRYDVGNTYVAGLLGGAWGNGDLTNIVLSSTGSFRSGGFSSAVVLGRVFTLFDTMTYANPRFHTKAPPKPVGGYAVKLDLSGHVGYRRDQVDGFTDSSGFARGAEQYKYGLVGGQAKLFASMPGGRWTSTPFVAATVDQQFGYSHSLDIPTQVTQIGDTLFFGSAQTFWGGQLGVDVLDASGVRIGINGYYRSSSQYELAGGQGYIRLPLSQWLFAPPVVTKH